MGQSGAWPPHSKGSNFVDSNEVTMKRLTLFGLIVLSLLLLTSSSRITYDLLAQDANKPPDVIVLAKEAKLGQVTFHHLDHLKKDRSMDGTKQIACVECHHTAQPAAEAAKVPPHKMAWPADRTTTLTAELLAKDPNAPAVNICTDCHARADTKPKLLPEIPKLKFEGSTEETILTNQQAMHRTCGVCHDAVVKARPDLSPPPPTSKKCVACHKKLVA
jgi:cytochrome c553